jgi:hypothetical protein
MAPTKRSGALLPILFALFVFLSTAVASHGHLHQRHDAEKLATIEEKLALLEKRADHIVTTGVKGTLSPRLEIRNLKKKADQWALYILGMDRFQKMDQNNPLSYYQIAGLFYNYLFVDLADTATRYPRPSVRFMEPASPRQRRWNVPSRLQHVLAVAPTLPSNLRSALHSLNRYYNGLTAFSKLGSRTFRPSLTLLRLPPAADGKPLPTPFASHTGTRLRPLLPARALFPLPSVRRP